MSNDKGMYLKRVIHRDNATFYSLHPNLFVLFLKSKLLREYYLLSCLRNKMYKFPELPSII